MLNKLIAFSWNHHNTDITLRDDLSLSSDNIVGFYKSAEIYPHVNELAILSTCNRIEFYMIIDNYKIAKQWIINQYDHLLKKKIKFDNNKPDVYLDIDVVKHIFSVASGMESMALGEYQILNQVQKTIKNIFYNNTSAHFLNQLFTKAVQCGTVVQKRTNLGKKNNSISNLAAIYITDIYPKVENILIIGAGETAQLCVQKFIELGIKEVFISNRTEYKGAKLAEDLDINHIPFNAISTLVPDMDIVLTATKSIKYLFKKRDISAMYLNKKEGPIFVDISTPRNIDPDIRNINNTILIDIDNIKCYNRNNVLVKSKEVVLANKIVKLFFNNFIDYSKSIYVFDYISDTNLIS